jgi:SAM-dependent methyltransferase
MINSPQKFQCPEHYIPLESDEMLCPVDRRQFHVGPMPSLQDDGPPFDVYDFRPDVPYVIRDRDQIGAHWKVISGFLELEHDRLTELGYSDFGAAASSGLGVETRKSVTRAFYGQRSLRNLADLIYWRIAKRQSGKLAGVDSVASSFAGYGRAYELASTFAVPNWLGWLNGQFVRAPVALHHLANMRMLNEILRDWGAKEVLEFGCGSGINMLLLRQACGLTEEVELSGFDYPSARFLTARSAIEYFDLAVSDLFMADGLNPPLADESFDVVFSHYVVEQMAGFEDRALDQMLRISRMGVVMFETAIHHPTLDQRMFMAHSGYSRDLPKAVLDRDDIIVERIDNDRKERFFGSPNVIFVLRKKSAQ